MDSSSIQYGTACTSSGNSTAVPWINFDILCTSVISPEFIMFCTPSGGASPSGRASLISSTAWGNFVISVLWMGSLGSRYHLPESSQDGCPSGFSLSMIRLVSSVNDTVLSWPIWNADRMYCVRTNGLSCFASIAR